LEDLRYSLTSENELNFQPFYVAYICIYNFFDCLRAPQKFSEKIETAYTTHHHCFSGTRTEIVEHWAFHLEHLEMSSVEIATASQATEALNIVVVIIELLK
jgi:hypothetical protein